MQQLQSPHFSLAQIGNPEAIAALLTEKLKSRGIKVRVARKGEDIGVLLEAVTVPHQAEMVALVKQELALLQPEVIRSVRVFGLERGQKNFAWLEKFELETVSSSLAIQPLEAWLRQGEDQLQPAIDPVSSSASEAIRPEASIQPEANRPTAQFSAQPQQLTSFLRFYFSFAETALLPLTDVKEVLSIPQANILAVPFMSHSIMGVYNYRGEILWLVDLAVHLGLERWQPTKVVTAIALEIEQKSLALVVPQVGDIETHDMTQMQPPAADLFFPQLLPFMQGYLTRSSSPVFDLNVLIQDPRLQVHR